MFRETEQAYRDYTLDVYEANGLWHCDYWKPGNDDGIRGTISDRKRKVVVAEAERRIDEWHEAKN